MPQSWLRLRDERSRYNVDDDDDGRTRRVFRVEGLGFRENVS